MFDDEDLDELEDDFIEPEFTPPTAERVKTSIDKIIGRKTTVRKSKKTPEDKKREKFVQLMFDYERAYTRGVLTSEFLDMEDWDDTWMDIIDTLLELIYTPAQLNIIHFYIFDRIDDQGQVIPYDLGSEKYVFLDTPENLYELLKQIK